MKKVLYFLGSFLAIVGALGSLGFLIASKEFVLAIGEAIVCYCAYPTIKAWIGHVTNE